MDSELTRPALSRRVRRGLSRWGLLAATVALVLAFGGDRAQTQAVTPLQGIDPLEILDLQVKPNVIIVFDSSGSMQNRLDDNVSANTGDSGGAKLHLGKTVMRQVIRDNADKANFMFGQYTQTGTVLQNQGYSDLTAGTGRGRFFWETTDASMPGGYLIRGRLLTPAFPLLVDGTNQNFRFSENGGGRTCSAVVANGPYTAGAALATAIQAAMNTAACGPTPRNNTYTVTFDALNWRFTVALNTGGQSFAVLASNAAGSTDLGPDIGWTTNTGSGTGSRTGANLFWLLVRLNNEGYNDSPTAPITRYHQAHSTRMFNGQVLSVLTNGTVCAVAPGTPASGLVGPPVDAGPADPYHFMLQRLTGAACPGAPDGAPIKFVFAGGNFGGSNSVGCNGFDSKVALAACNVPGTTQIANIDPFLKGEIDTELGRTGTDCVDPATCPLNGYRERRSGLLVTVPAQVGIYGNGSTPIGNSLRDIRGVAGQPGGSVKRNFSLLWDTEISPGVGNIQSHSVPRERTLVLFVTDGDDTCGGSLAAAYQAQLLYDPIDGSVAPNGTLVPTVAGSLDSQDRAFASSVTTYVVNFGSGASLTNSNYIAWGGSGLLNGTWGAAPTPAQRANCVTCRDAFAAPDAATLASVLNAIINQGAQAGLFTAQQSLIANVYEMATSPGTNPTDKKRRYDTIVPVRFEATFTLPGFQGDLRAYFADRITGVLEERWMCGATPCGAAGKLKQLVADGIATCSNPTPRAGGPVPYCSFSDLQTKIPRRIYTTERNGVFNPSIAQLQSQVAPGRRTLWPGFDTTTNVLDVSLAIDTMTFAQLQSQFRVCRATPSPSLEPVGTPPEELPAACLPAAGGVANLAQGRQEAREIILSFMAGAEPFMTADAIPRRTTLAAGGRILFKPRDWQLAETTLATPAVVTATFTDLSGNPVGAPASTLFVTEWTNFQSDATPPLGGSAALVDQGLAIADDVAVMTVVYLASNDMLHAFRAGRCLGCADTGGEELWGFVPFDQLHVLTGRYLHQPPTRDPHDYMFSSSIRVAELFVPDSTSAATVSGVWRRVLYIGRGVAGKYITALDITAPGTYGTPATSARGPIPLWSRGNPDTLDGTAGGANANSAADRLAYAKMGQTWSLPAVAWVGTARSEYVTPRVSRGLEFVLFVGSGYSTTAGEGETFYSLDPLTGDVAHAVDIAAAAGAAGLQRTNPDLPANALVAAPAGFAKEQFQGQNMGPLSGPTTSLYFADLHGRMWKLLVADPDTVLPAADLGEDQPVAVPAGLIGLPFDNPQVDPIPHIFTSSGSDRRVDKPKFSDPRFKLFGFKDESGPNAPPVLENGVKVFPPFRNLFVRDLDPTIVSGVPPFRGTVQPATVRSGDTDGIALFAATRFNPANSPEAPVGFPCRSSFDSVVYLLNAATGGLKFDSGVGDGTYILRKESRLVGIGTAADPETGATKIFMDEGIKKAGVPPPPPYKEGTPPSSGSGTLPAAVGGGNVAIASMGSSVCNQ